MSSKVFKGTVVSAKMKNVVVVAVDMPKRHKLYDKVIVRTKRFKARDEIGVEEGDTVIIQESRPLSKEVTWIVIEKVQQEDVK